MALPPVGPLIEIAATALAGIAGLKGVYNAILDLVAKWRARSVIVRKVTDDPDFRNLVERLRVDQSDAELKKVSEEIARALSGLSEDDRRRVYEGLKQSSKSAERRYINNLIQ